MGEKNHILAISFMLFLASYSAIFSQEKDMEKLTEIAFKKAQKMSDAFLDKDYDTFLSYLPKKLIDLSGGKEKMKATFEKGIAPNFTFVKAQVYHPHQSIYYKNSFQCVMLYKQFMTIDKKMFYVSTSLIAIYKFNTKSWEFIGVVNKSIEQLQNFEPLLSSELEIQKQTKPIRVF